MFDLNREARLGFWLLMAALLALAGGRSRNTSRNDDTGVPNTPKKTLEERVRAVPVSETYTRGSQVSIEFHDTHQQQILRFTNSEKGLLKDTLDKLPADDLLGVQQIGTLPLKELTTFIGQTVPGTIVFYVLFDKSQAAKRLLINESHALSTLLAVPPGDPRVRRETLAAGFFILPTALAHEVGHQVQFTRLSDEENQQWSDLNRLSQNPLLDFVEAYTFFPAFGERDLEEYYRRTNRLPYGATNVLEDFASTFANWAANSGSANPILNEAVQRALAGHPILLQKVLYIASLFADPKTQTLPFYDDQHGVFGQDRTVPVPILLTRHPYVRTADLLSFGDFTFHIRDNQITRIQEKGGAETVLADPIPVPPIVFNRMPVTDQPPPVPCLATRPGTAGPSFALGLRTPDQSYVPHANRRAIRQRFGAMRRLLGQIPLTQASRQAGISAATQAAALSHDVTPVDRP